MVLLYKKQNGTPHASPLHFEIHMKPSNPNFLQFSIPVVPHATVPEPKKKAHCWIKRSTLNITVEGTQIPCYFLSIVHFSITSAGGLVLRLLSVFLIFIHPSSLLNSKQSLWSVFPLGAWTLKSALLAPVYRSETALANAVSDLNPALAIFSEVFQVIFSFTNLIFGCFFLFSEVIEPYFA